MRKTSLGIVMQWLISSSSAWALLVAPGCSSGTDVTGGSGGTRIVAGSGGTAGSSGTGTGGTSSSGGISGTGDAHATGGANATGGNTTAAGSGGSTGISMPPACPTHIPLSCPAIDPTKAFGSLSQADISALCDCEAVAYGGYGGTNTTCTCADGHLATNTNPPDKAGCIAAYKATSACTWVMSDYFKCMNLMQDPCNMMGMTLSLGDPSCAGGMNNPACTTGQ